MKDFLESAIVSLVIGASVFGLIGPSTAQTLTPLITPYVNESDMASITQIFNSGPDANASDVSLRYVHDGLDIAPKGNLKPFRAACSGRVHWVLAFDDLVNVMIECDSTYTIEYTFEPQSVNTGQTQLANIAVVQGQTVSQGDAIGSLYVANALAHVHFAVWENWIPSCPEQYFDPEARNSVSNLVHVRFPGAGMCHGGEVTPAPLVTPYVNESDVASINEAFSAEGSTSPWGFAHGGIDFFPNGNLRPFRAACSGVVDLVQLLQNNVTSNRQVNLRIVCNPYVSNTGGYFPPLAVEYVFEPMSAVQADGQAQLDNIVVANGQAVSQGDVVGSLLAIGVGAHVHFGTIPLGSMLASGVPSIQTCPEPHFAAEAKTSILNLLHVVWPGASMCYQTSIAAVLPTDGLWAIDAETNGQNGRGFQVETHRGLTVLTYYGYRAGGHDHWYLATGALANGSFTGSMTQYQGGTALGAAYAPATANGSAGTVAMNFTSSTAGSITLPGEPAKAISKFAFGGSGSPAVVPSNGLWVIDAELNGQDGRGFQIEQHGSFLVFTYYGYDAGGQETWYLAAAAMTGSSFTGALSEYGGGMVLGGTYSAATETGSPGPVTIAFTSTTTGIITLPGESAKAISKFSW